MTNVVKMTNVVEMQPPEMSFSFRRPFRINDTYNGPSRGTWWFRSKATGELVGPYHTEHAAAINQQAEDAANGFL